jgi:N-acetylglucosaminyl-diphospho-decaprenol L-rhamnosyltransferase
VSTPDVRVGIVSWNTAALLDRCLAALPAALGDLHVEVVVVDNHSSDDSVEVAGRHGVTVVVNGVNEGYGRGMNQALAGTEAPVLIALNPDTEPPPGSLAALVAALQARPDVGIAAPRLVHPDGRPQHSDYRFPSVALAAVVCFTPGPLQRGRIGTRWRLEAARAAEPGPVDWVIGAVHVIRRDALAGEPPYSERWFMYAEDLELCWRLAEAGWRTVLEPSVVVPHSANAAGAQAWGDDRDRRWWATTYDCYARMRGRRAMRAFALVNTLGVALRVALGRLLGRVPVGDPATRRHTAAGLARVLPVHAAAVRGPEHAARVAGVTHRDLGQRGS